ncbi:MAG TPA: hypothetical protein VGJ22_08915 [Anaerolineales bacterium]|jgi:hypothetical protein
MSDYYGHQTGVLESPYLRLEYLAHGGPRIVRLFLRDSGENLLGEFPDIGWDTHQGYYQLFGGHRLLSAPEVIGVSYLPDDAGLGVRETASGVELSWEPEPSAGLAKIVTVSLAEERAAVRLEHRIINRFGESVQAAPWAVTIFPLGGTAYLPSPPAGSALQPDRRLSLWPYSRWDDPRLRLAAAGIMIEARAGMPPLKLGTFVKEGTCAYLRDAILFTKQTQPEPGEYPDNGCNVEVYCSDRLIELETLGPLVDLMPGGSATHIETWEVDIGEKAARRLKELFSHGGSA